MCIPPRKAIVYAIILIVGYGSVLSYPIGLSITYANANASEDIRQHMGVGIQWAWMGYTIFTGIERLVFQSRSGIHTNAQHLVSMQDAWAVPVMASARYSPVPRFQVVGSVGVRFMIHQTLNEDTIQRIESVQTALNTPLLTHYSESLQSHGLIQLGMMIQLTDHIQVVAQKSWQHMVNHVSYTYVNQYNASKRSVIDYAPVSLALHYTF